MRRDFSPPPKKSKKRLYIAALVIIVLFVWFFSTKKGSEAVDKSVSTVIKKTQPDFPVISTKGLTDTQKSMLQLVKQEYDKAPKSYDMTVMKYTEGNKESWCTDFISWIYSKAGVPFTNPNSGFWRIPGVLTLQQQYKDAGTYAEASSGYTPKLGDVAFYIGAQTPDNSSAEHAAIVLKVDKGIITTIGGNEGLGIMRIRSESLQANISKSLVGFGQLE